MTNVSLMSEDDLLKFKDYLVMTQKSLDAGKHKALAVISAVGGWLTVGAGVTLTVLFPNPVTIAVLGGIGIFFVYSYLINACDWQIFIPQNDERYEEAWNNSRGTTSIWMYSWKSWGLWWWYFNMYKLFWSDWREYVWG